jgi:hypothetical protein
MVSLMFEHFCYGCFVCSDSPGEMCQKGACTDLHAMGIELYLIDIFFFFVVVMLAEFFPGTKSPMLATWQSYATDAGHCQLHCS